MKYNPSFITEVDIYIESTQKDNQSPTVAGFAVHIGTDENSIWAWATKHTKDAQGVVTYQLARPEFFAAIQKIKKIEDEKKREDDKSLNPKQEMFCQLYAVSREFFGNATQSYCLAYGINPEDKDAYRGAKSSAFNLLTNPDITERISDLLRDVNEQVVDEELGYVIRQRYELPSKIAAIREWNKIKGRITDKVDLTSKGKEIKTAQIIGFNYLPPAKEDAPGNTNNQTNA
jgi:hypothetical protein